MKTISRIVGCLALAAAAMTVVAMPAQAAVPAGVHHVSPAEILWPN
jgi:hypothetical protein